MLPFLKNRDEGGASGPVDTIEREPDDDEGFDMLAAFKAGDKKALKMALESLCAHIQDQDVMQDQEMAP